MLITYILLRIYLWLYWLDFPPVAVSEGNSSCGAQVSHCSGLSCCKAQAVGTRASGVVVLRL